MKIVFKIAEKHLEAFQNCEVGANEDEIIGPSPLTTLTILSRHKDKIECQSVEECAQILSCCLYGTFPNVHSGVANRLKDELLAINGVCECFAAYDKIQEAEFQQYLRDIAAELKPANIKKSEE